MTNRHNLWRTGLRSCESSWWIKSERESRQFSNSASFQYLLNTFFVFPASKSWAAAMCLCVNWIVYILIFWSKIMKRKNTQKNRKTGFEATTLINFNGKTHFGPEKKIQMFPFYINVSGGGNYTTNLTFEDCGCWKMEKLIRFWVANVFTTWQEARGRQISSSDATFCDMNTSYGVVLGRWKTFGDIIDDEHDTVGLKRRFKGRKKISMKDIIEF